MIEKWIEGTLQDMGFCPRRLPQCGAPGSQEAAKQALGPKCRGGDSTRRVKSTSAALTMLERMVRYGRQSGTKQRGWGAGAALLT